MSLNLFANSRGRVESNADVAVMLNDSLATGVMLHASDEFLDLDHNNDGYMDLPRVRQLNAANRWYYKNKNYMIEVTAKNLAEAIRLNPPKNNYSVWIVAENGTTKNLGQLVNKNAKKASLKTTTPFNVKEIFITAEEQGNLNYPSGIEISRTTFNK